MFHAAVTSECLEWAIAGLPREPILIGGKQPEIHLSEQVLQQSIIPLSKMSAVEVDDIWADLSDDCVIRMVQYPYNIESKGGGFLRRAGGQG